MEPKREQALVGLFILIVAGVLIFTVFTVSGAFSGAGANYVIYVPFGGGIEPGAAVRYAGGVKVGRVEHTRLDPKDPRRIEITFSVKQDTPIKTDSVVKIMSLNPLGENHLEIIPGSAQAPAAKPGATLQAEPYRDFNSITRQLDELGPKVQELVVSLNARAGELKETVARVNDLLNAQNRANLSASLGDVRGMLEENRPKINSAMTHIDAATGKLSPLLDDFKKAVAQTQETLEHVDATITENRPDLRRALEELRDALGSANSVASRLDRTLEVNSENIDEILDNMRRTTENLKQFTNTIKTRPYTLIRSSTPKDRQP
jgi:phospholipid/cholesterol/gamma-HCH transport system substrate-binding protein